MHIYVHIHICIYICICTYVCIYLHNSCMRACATVQQLPCHDSYCERILSLAQTSCRLSFPPALLPLRRAGRPPAGQLPYMFAKKSVQIRASSRRSRCCCVAQASSNHPRWCRPHPVCLLFTLAHGRGSHPRQKSVFAAIFAGFSVYPHLWIVFVKTFQKCQTGMTTNPTNLACCPLLALFVQTPLCLHLSSLDLHSVSCAGLVTIPLEAALH